MAIMLSIRHDGMWCICFDCNIYFRASLFVCGKLFIFFFVNLIDKLSNIFNDAKYYGEIKIS